MHILDEDLGATTSSTFETTRNAKVWVKVESETWGGGTITLQVSIPNSDSAAFATFSPGGTDATFTADKMEAYDLPGGCHFKFSSATATGCNYYISGNSINLL